MNGNEFESILHSKKSVVEIFEHFIYVAKKTFQGFVVENVAFPAPDHHGIPRHIQKHTTK